MDKLPELYTNTFSEKIDNSLEYIKISNNEKNNNSKEMSFNLKDKINNIFKSKSYIYKINVEIKLKDKIINETLIGKTKNNLITINNELISIDDIVDINIK